MENTKKKEDVCLLDSASTHTIFRSRHFFSSMTLRKTHVHTISGPIPIIDGFGNATIFLPKGTILHIENAFLSSRSKRNLLSFKDVRRNGYHVETIYEQNKEYIGITSYKMGLKTIHEKLEASSMGLYCVMIKVVETYSTISWRLVNPDQFGLWHDRLGHPGATMMRRIIQNTKGHPLKDTKVLLSKDYNCEACSQGKLIIKPSITKFDLESPLFLQRIQGDICGPIQPPSAPVMDMITFSFLISLVIFEKLEMLLMDIVTAYLYGSLDSYIYMKIPEGFKLPDACNPRNLFSIKLQRSLYELKQSGRMWYQRLSEYLIKERYKNDLICPCVFIKKSETGFSIVAVYVDDINLIGTPEELAKTAEYLKNEFEVKDLGKTKLCLGLQLEHKTNGIIVH